MWFSSSKHVAVYEERAVDFANTDIDTWIKELQDLKARGVQYVFVDDGRDEYCNITFARDWTQEERDEAARKEQEVVAQRRAIQEQHDRDTYERLKKKYGG